MIADFQEDQANSLRQSNALSRNDLVLSLDGYEGPIDLLLSLSREQKVDLTRISILELANQ